MSLLYKEESYQLIGACYEVYKEKGCGFLEDVYQEALEMELGFQEIPYTAQKQIQLFYKNKQMKRKYVPDLICFDKILIELKAVEKLIDKHRSQCINYLNATGFRLALLVNFGHYPKLEWERIVLSQSKET